MRAAIGSPATGIAGFARTSVSGRRRVPSPAASTSAWGGGTRRSAFCEQHVTRFKAALLAFGEEERAVRGNEVVAFGAAERSGRGADAGVGPFDLDERAERRLVDRDRHVAVRELLAVLLVTEPDLE